MTLFQLIMLGLSAFFAFKVYEHIQTLKDPEDVQNEEQKNTFNSGALHEEGDAAMQKKDYQKALAIYSEANYKEPKNAETLFKIGYALAEQDRDDEALEYYKEALSLDEKNTYIHQAMASLYRKIGEFASARNHLNRSIELDKNNPITYFNYANLLVDMQNKDEAKEMYKKALALDPSLKEAQEELDKL